MTSPSACLPIENHGVIGNLNTVALVGMDGGVDFLCFPNFDSPTVFASLLDPNRGGCFKLAPVLGHARPKQLYLPDSNVLLTRFLSEEGVAEVTDFMPVRTPWPVHGVIRQARAIRGDIRFRVECAPRFDYGRTRHQVEEADDGLCFGAEGTDPLALRLRATVPLSVHEGDGVAEFRLRAGESACFALVKREPFDPGFVLTERWFTECLQDTLDYWRDWIGQSQYRGRWRESVNRSALVLKLMTSSRHGSMVAAPTFGLPERVGGERNWDYRYTWIRDTSFSLYALMRLGFKDEARAFFRWLGRVCDGSGEGEPLAIMYKLDGSPCPEETDLAHLAGYGGSRPVRIGNGAAGQLQLDIYGELIDAVYTYDKFDRSVTFDVWQRLVRLVDWVCDHWTQPDEGVWEVRGGRREFLFSRLMCWVALDRALRLAAQRQFPGPLERWARVCAQIRRDILENFWNPDLQAFVQYRGASVVDASSLLMPLVRFLPPNDLRWLDTLRQIERRLVDDSLVYRYHPEQAADDGLRGGEGTFSMCSFWYVECVSRSGDLQRARLLFEKTLGHANHLGLFGEELGPRGEHLGNFPQALTHLALISAAWNLDRNLDRTTQPGGFPPGPRHESLRP